MSFTAAFSKIAKLRPEVRLNPVQEEAVQRVLDAGGTQIFAHDVGLGKTLAAIASFEKMKSLGKATKALVVVPASLKDNFVTHGVKKFTTSSVHYVDEGHEHPDPKKDYNVVSYELFKKDPHKYIQGAKADTIIMDEMHRLRDESTENYKKSLEARRSVKNFIGLTGSVINNSPKDIVPMLDVTTAKTHNLGGKDSFLNKLFTERVSKSGLLGLYGENVTSWEPRRPPPYIGKTLGKYIHYKTISDVDSSAMPKLDLKTIKVDMSDKQADTYRWALNEAGPLAKHLVENNLPVDQKQAQHVFAKLIKARQACNSTHLFDSSMSLSDAAKKTPKVKKILDDIEEHFKSTPDGQVVLYSNLVQSGTDVLSQGLTDRGIKHGLFLGSGQEGITTKKRIAAVEDFNAGKLKAIVLSGAGSEGISFPNATLHVSMDGHFNPEKINQSEGRSRRFGGQQHRDAKDRVVEVRRYISTVPLERKAADIGLNAIKGKWFDVLDTVRGKSKQMVSADEWVYGVAKKKDEMNAHLKSIMKTAAASENATLKIPTKYNKVLQEYYAGTKDKDQTIDTLNARLQDEYHKMMADYEKKKNVAPFKNYLSLAIPGQLMAYALGLGRAANRAHSELADRVQWEGFNKHSSSRFARDFEKSAAGAQKLDEHDKKVQNALLVNMGGMAAVEGGLLFARHKSRAFNKFMARPVLGRAARFGATIGLPLAAGYAFYPKEVKLDAKKINTLHALKSMPTMDYNKLLSGEAVRVPKKELTDKKRAQDRFTHYLQHGD